MKGRSAHVAWLLLLAIALAGTLCCAASASLRSDGETSLPRRADSTQARPRRELLGDDDDDDDSKKDDDDSKKEDDDDNDQRGGGNFEGCEPDYYYNYNLRSQYACKDTNYRIFRDVPEDVCEDECSCLDDCVAYTYNTDTEACYLKKECNKGEYNPVDKSGFKQPRTTYPQYPQFPPSTPAPVAPVGCDRNGNPTRQDQFGFGYCECGGRQVGEVAGIAACSALTVRCSAFQAFTVNDPLLDAIQTVCDSLAEENCRAGALSIVGTIPACQDILRAGSAQCGAREAQLFFETEVNRMCAPFNPSSNGSGSNGFVQG